MQKAKKLTMSKKASTGVTLQKQSQEAMNITAKIGSCTLQVPQKDDVNSIINPRITDVVKGVNYFKPGLPKKVVVAPPDTLPDAVYRKKDKETAEKIIRAGREYEMAKNASKVAVEEKIAGAERAKKTGEKLRIEKLTGAQIRVMGNILFSRDAIKLLHQCPQKF